MLTRRRRGDGTHVRLPLVDQLAEPPLEARVLRRLRTNRVRRLGRWSSRCWRGHGSHPIAGVHHSRAATSRERTSPTRLLSPYPRSNTGSRSVPSDRWSPGSSRPGDRRYLTGSSPNVAERSDRNMPSWRRFPRIGPATSPRSPARRGRMTRSRGGSPRSSASISAATTQPADQGSGERGRSQARRRSNRTGSPIRNR